MKQIYLFLAAVLLVGAGSCKWKHIKGSGVIITQDRNVSNAERISLKGSYDVELTQGPVTSVKVEGDDNILPFIIVQQEEGMLVIRTKKNFNYSTENNIKVIITTNKLSQVRISGSGNIVGKNKFTGSDKLNMSISGSGNITLDVNAPSVESEITGSGSITVNGETQNQRIRIAGSGDYNADGLKSENATVKITGNGDVKIFADATLDIHIAGAGSIYYKGNPSIKQKVVGSGDVKKID